MPGVGIYTPRESTTKRATPNFSMAKKLKERKKSKMGAASPGPAAYLSKDISTFRSYSIPKEPRHVGDSFDKMTRKKFNLGPGQYELESIFEKKKGKGTKFPRDVDQRSPKYVE